MAQFNLMIKLNRIPKIWLACTGLFLAGMSTAEERGDFSPPEFSIAPTENVILGQLLFYDPILSGNKNTACSTCHHPKFATSDGVSLALGEGGIGLGPDRRVDPNNPPEQRIPRNAPALFNLGAKQFSSLFHDGRVEADPQFRSGLRTPLEEEMVEGFNSVLSAQAMFPVLSGDEMSGHYSENDVSKVVRQGFLAQSGGAWDILAKRVNDIPEYRQMFDEIIGKRPVLFTDISNMLADFIAAEWRADNSDFDQFLKGEALGKDAFSGMVLFYGKAGCGTCHSGVFQTDHDYHAIAMPQIGPGKAARFEDHNRDTGRIRVTGIKEDAYRFRTPSLRNIVATGPYGHDGAYKTLEAVVRHHLHPVLSLKAYDRTQAIFPELKGAADWGVLDDPNEMAAIAAANELAPIELNDTQVKEILAFLGALTDLSNLTGLLGVPKTVPSGLAVD